ncbi:hypothetical protein JTB14_021592 [Gonioctena quinquepunctata]|nr:hypothetical protein JTB14_021592 [Gonioctena quinquepunctata]
MNEMDFFGHSVLEREKCRQKFMNVQYTYTKYKDQIRQTGKGFVKKPPFFHELDDILEDTRKSNPVNGLQEVLQEQNEQHHEQTMGIIELLKKQAKDRFFLI